MANYCWELNRRQSRNKENINLKFFFLRFFETDISEDLPSFFGVQNDHWRKQIVFFLSLSFVKYTRIVVKMERLKILSLHQQALKKETGRKNTTCFLDWLFWTLKQEGKFFQTTISKKNSNGPSTLWPNVNQWCWPRWPSVKRLGLTVSPHTGPIVGSMSIIALSRRHLITAHFRWPYLMCRKNRSKGSHPQCQPISANTSQPPSTQWCWLELAQV